MAIVTRGESRGDVIKVVLIDTRYIVTEPESFKSVVQRLTGKDSCVSWIEEESFTGASTKRKRAASSTVVNNDVADARPAQRGGGGGGGGGAGWRLSKGMSFKDLDKMMLEIPAAEELRQLLSQV